MLRRMKYYKIYKPYGVLSQFSSLDPLQKCLSDLFKFPKDVYPIGRLDKDSEGLLLLTNDPGLNQLFLSPSRKVPKVYLIQVEGKPSPVALEILKSGVYIQIDGKKFKTSAAKIKLLSNEPLVADRHPPIRVRKSIPDSWLEMTIYEGKNRQVRRMMAAVGYPVLRLIRIAVGPVFLLDLQPGEYEEISKPVISQ